MKYYNESIDEVYKKLKTNKDGLSNEEAQKRIVIKGRNKIEEAKKRSIFKEIIDQFNDPMIIILIVVALFMIFYGLLYSHEFTDSIVIGVVVLLNATMGFIQQKNAEVTLDGLKKYITTNCKVKRDGAITIIDSELIVPGDIIVLEAGDKIPADARIVLANGLLVDESPLTGESMPVKKNNSILKGNKSLHKQNNMIFSGSSVVKGNVEAIVVKTGMNSEIGLVAVSLNTPYKVETPLQIKIKEISKKITFLIFLIIIFIFFYGVFNHYKTLEIIMLCVSLAVAAIPEGLPAVITISLSYGTNALAKKKTVVRQMSAVETLGSTDIICSDKTGTITQNKMQVVKTSLLNEEYFYYISVLANETIIDHEKLVGDPTETCLLEYAISQRKDPADIRKKYPRLMTAPFDSERKLMSSINKIEGKDYLLVKGSLENMLPKCKHYYKDGKIIKLTNSQEFIKEEKLMAQKALRVMAFAYKEIDSVPKTVDNVLALEKDLIYVGIVGIIDPPRTDVKEAVKRCQEAGIRPVMITGDSLITACAIAKEVGIIKNDSEGISGEELDKYSDLELIEVVKKYNVYARVSSDHKTRIVTAWQANDKVVAMTGDGINDAPAIKKAHVGVGMGITGTEITKSVSDIVLLDDSFSTIVDAISEGRTIFTNIRNNVVFSLSSNFAELFIVLIGMFCGYSILLPIQILFIDLITDTIPSICLAFEKGDKDVMKRPPRGIKKPLFTPYAISMILYSAFIESLFALFIFFIVLNFYSVAVAGTLALLSVVVQEIVFSLSCRNIKKPMFSQGLFSNKAMNKGLIIVVLLEVIFFLTPMGSFIKVETINIYLLLSVFTFNILGLGFYELGKPILKKVFKD